MTLKDIRNEGLSISEVCKKYNLTIHATYNNVIPEGQKSVTGNPFYYILENENKQYNYLLLSHYDRFVGLKNLLTKEVEAPQISNTTSKVQYKVLGIEAVKLARKSK